MSVCVCVYVCVCVCSGYMTFAQVSEGIIRSLDKETFDGEEEACFAWGGGSWFCLALCFDFQIADSIHTCPRSLEEEGFDAQELQTRLEFLCTALQVDRTWQPGLVSDGQLRRRENLGNVKRDLVQRKKRPIITDISQGCTLRGLSRPPHCFGRMQLSLKLMPPKALVLLDEASVDLDILGRESLLAFLKSESVARNVTVIYCTHIFDGLDSWGTELLFVTNGTISTNLPFESVISKVFFSLSVFVLLFVTNGTISTSLPLESAISKVLFF